MKFHTVLVLALLALSAEAHADIAFEQRHQQWKSGVIGPYGAPRFRALTTYEEGGDYVVLALDRHPSNCFTQYLSLVVMLNAPERSAVRVEQLFGALRIDEMPIHNINYTFHVEAGEQFSVLSVTNFDK